MAYIVFQCLNRREQGSNILGLYRDSYYSIEFQCLNRREQGSNSGKICATGREENSFNASIGVSRVRTPKPPRTPRPAVQFQCLNRREQGSNSGETGRTGGSMKTFQCLNRREQGSNNTNPLALLGKGDGFNASIGVSRVRTAIRRKLTLADLAVSMPQSA